MHFRQRKRREFTTLRGGMARDRECEDSDSWVRPPPRLAPHDSLLSFSGSANLVGPKVATSRLMRGERKNEMSVRQKLRQNSRGRT